MLRVGNLQRSIDFYTQVLGMKLLRTSENPQYKYSLAFVGYGRRELRIRPTAFVPSPGTRSSISLGVGLARRDRAICQCFSPKNSPASQS